MLPFETRERRRRRAQHATLTLLVYRIELLAQFQTISTHTTQVRPMDQQTRQRYKRRIGMILPVAQLFLVKSLIVLRTRMSQSVMIWMIRLDQYPSRAIATPGSSR